MTPINNSPKRPVAIMRNLRILPAEPVLGGTAGAGEGTGAVPCTSCGPEAGTLAAFEIGTASAIAEMPHFSQNFAPTDKGVPHPLQNRGRLAVDAADTRVPHAVQNDWPSASSAPHFTHGLLISSPPGHYF